MYVVYFGTDRTMVRDAATKYIDAHMPKNGQLTTIDSRTFENGLVSDALGGSSLFGEPQWYVLDTPSEHEDFLVEVTDSLSALQESANTFIILENYLLAPAKKKYSKYTAVLEEFVGEKTERFNTFAMAEALAQKDKRRLWVLLQEARLSGLREEEIIGMLWWQLKSLRLAAATRSADEAGMKDFPYNKSKRALNNFPNNNAVALSRSLLELYHAGHSGMRDMDIALEEWVLTL